MELVLLTVITIFVILGFVMIFDMHRMSLKNSVFQPIQYSAVNKVLSELMYLRGMVSADMSAVGDEGMEGIDGMAVTGGPGMIFRSADGKHVATSLPELMQKMNGGEMPTDLSPEDLAEFKKMMEDEMKDDDDNDPSERWKKGG
jgi:hypothetical protein